MVLKLPDVPSAGVCVTSGGVQMSAPITFQHATSGARYRVFPTSVSDYRIPTSETMLEKLD